MANRADVYVNNGLTGNINVRRKLQDGTIDLETVVTPGNKEMIPLQEPTVSLVIGAPAGVDTKDCPFRVKSDVDLAVACSRTDSWWTMNIVPNDLPPTAPTTVNVDVGEVGEG